MTDAIVGKHADVEANDQTRALSAVISDYLQLTKPRIVVMILVTTAATAMIGAGGMVPVAQLFWLLVGTAAVAASAGAANQVWERSIDRRMTRTSTRPLPAGRVGTIASRPLHRAAGRRWLGFAVCHVRSDSGAGRRGDMADVRLGLHADENSFRMEYDRGRSGGSTSGADWLHRDWRITG